MTIFRRVFDSRNSGGKVPNQFEPVNSKPQLSRDHEDAHDTLDQSPDVLGKSATNEEGRKDGIFADPPFAVDHDKGRTRVSQPQTTGATDLIDAALHAPRAGEEGKAQFPDSNTLHVIGRLDSEPSDYDAGQVTTPPQPDTPVVSEELAEKAAVAVAQMHGSSSAGVKAEAWVEQGDSGPQNTGDKDTTHGGIAPQGATEQGEAARTRVLGFQRGNATQKNPLDDSLETTDEPARLYPTGWLAIVEGPGLGHAMPVYNRVCKLGRRSDQDICLNFGDTSISRSNHAAIAFDEEDAQFYLGHGGKANLVRLNGRPVLSTETLNHGDTIRIGETTLRFAALCGSEFSWGGR